MLNSRSTLSPSAAFSGTILPTKTPFYYQAGLMVIALAMVLLPLIYLALIVAMAQLVWWHLTENITIFDVTRGRANLLSLLIYLAPAIAGIIFVAFLIKPLFSSRAKASKAYIVKPDEQPELFAFVHKICDLVGAAHPREVRLDCQVNASAGFRNGWWGFFGNNLALTIGLPLVAGMTIRQVAGVLAHEFGHFAQGAGMRMSFVIVSVNQWFARVVYERDSWDEWLEQWAAHEDWRIKAVFKLAQGGVWAGRKVLWCLMQVGHAISCFMSRQMEFDADSYEAKIAGSSEFARTFERLRLLSAAHSAAISDAHSAWQHHELPDDLPALILWRESVMPADVRQKLIAHADSQKTHWAQTHPCDADRVRAVEALGANGIIHLEDPAACLFEDFTAISKAVTLHYYEFDQELPLEKAKLRPASDVKIDRQAAEDAEKKLEDFFGKTFDLNRLRPLQETTIDTWWIASNNMLALAASYEGQLKEYQELGIKAFSQSVGSDLVWSGFTLSSPEEFMLNTSGTNEIQTSLLKTNEARRNLESAMEGYESAAYYRLGAALLWLDTQPAEDKAAREKRALLIQIQRVFARATKEFITIRQARTSLKLIVANAGGHRDGIGLEQRAKDIARRSELALNQVLQMLGDLKYPYLPEGTSIRDSMHGLEPDDNEFARAFKAVDICDDALVPLIIRVMGDLCGMALKAEKVLKTMPRPVPASASQTANSPLPPPTLN